MTLFVGAVSTERTRRSRRGPGRAGPGRGGAGAGAGGAGARSGRDPRAISLDVDFVEGMRTWGLVGALKDVNVSLDFGGRFTPGLVSLGSTLALKSVGRRQFRLTTKGTPQVCRTEFHDPAQGAGKPGGGGIMHSTSGSYQEAGNG